MQSKGKQKWIESDCSVLDKRELVTAYALWRVATLAPMDTFDQAEAQERIEEAFEMLGIAESKFDGAIVRPPLLADWFGTSTGLALAEWDSHIADTAFEVAARWPIEERGGQFRFKAGFGRAIRQAHPSRAACSPEPMCH